MAATTNVDLSGFQNEINSIALFAKRINFDVENGDFSELVRLWLLDGQKFMNAVQDNKDQAISIVKFYLKLSAPPQLS